MTVFAYSGRSHSGAVVSGQIEAADGAAVAAHLEATGITPTGISAQGAQSLDITQLLARAGVGFPTTADLTLFTRQMLTITRSGMPLLRGVRSLATTTRNPMLRRSLVDVVADLESGRELAGAFARHPQIFSDLFVSLVRVGEQSGTLERAFAQLAEYLSAEQDLRDRVTAALRYPLIVMAAIVAAMLVLTIVVIPKFAPMFKALGDALPLPTRILLGATALVRDHGGMMLLVAALLIVAWQLYVRTAAGKLAWHRRRLQLPVFGRLVQESVLARSLTTLSITLAAGLPMLEALRLIARAAGNEYMSARFEQLRTAVQTGESLSSAAASIKVIPPLALQMLQIGEETGELTQMLDEIAGYFKREVACTLSNLSAMIEPVMIMVVGGMVLILALGIFLPLWEMLGKMAGT